MKINHSVFGVFLVLLTTMLGSAHAASFMMSFQASGFQPSNGNHAPTDPVTGNLVWEAPDSLSPIQSFDSINLHLDGHTYSIHELGYAPDYTLSLDSVYGTISGDGISNLTDDFFIVWNRHSSQPFGFAYASSRTSGIWVTDVGHDPTCFTSFSITEIPEPSGLRLVALGAGVLIVFAKQRRQRPS